jgi:hypothetical protein
VLVTGQLTRAGSETVITSKIQDLNFTIGSAAHDISRVEAVNCIFSAFADGGGIGTGKSTLRNCGLFAPEITSTGNNLVTGSFGNKDIAWQLTDKILGYDYMTDANYIH